MTRPRSAQFRPPHAESVYCGKSSHPNGGGGRYIACTYRYMDGFALMVHGILSSLHIHELEPRRACRYTRVYSPSLLFLTTAGCV